MAWIYLLLAGAMEVAWSTALKFSEGFTRFWPSVAAVVLSLASFALLSLAMKTLPLGTAYGVWTGIGALGSALVGMVFLGEPREPLRLLCIFLIFAGIVGLKLTTRS
nr:MAG: QacE family quaternary ammonium compound efflux SMR transporter [Bacillota bacterium]